MSDYSISYKLTADDSGFQAVMTNVSKSLSGFGQKISDSTKKVTEGAKNWGLDLNQFYNKGSSIFKQFGVDVDKFASHFGMSGALMTGIVAVTTALNKLGEEMNKMSGEIVKGTGEIGNELRTLESTAKDAMLKGVGGSAQEAGKIIANLNTRFGVSGKEAVALADSFDQLSNVMGVSASDSVNSVADAIKKWGMITSETIPLLDRLTVASQESGASFDSLLSGITNGQAIFSQLGMSITDSIAFLSSLSAEGINTESAMTGLRTALAKFASNNESASQGFARVSEEIRNATSQTEAMQVATETFGTRAGAEMLRVLQSESVAVEDLKKKLDEATGALARTDEASRTASDAWEELKLSLQATFGSFGQGINDLFRDIIDTIKDFVAMIDPIIRPIGEVFRFVFSGIGTIVHATSTALLGLFDTETEVERISKLTADAITKQAEETAKLKNEVIILDQAERNRLKAQISQGMSQEYNQIRDLTKDLNGLIAKHEELEKKLQEVNENEYELGQIADQYRDIEGQIENLSAIIELHTVKYEGYKNQLSAITDVEQLEANERINTAQEEADEKERLQKQAFEKLESMSEQFTDKEYQQSLQRLKNEMANEVQLAQNAGKTQDEIFAIKQKYQTDINDLLRKQIDKEEEAELAKIEAIEKLVGETEETEALRKKITDYYANERKSIEEGYVEVITKLSQQKFRSVTEYEQKLLSQKISNLQTEIQNVKGTEDEIAEYRKAKYDELLELKRQQIEQERKLALDGVEDELEIKRINEYYDNELKNNTLENIGAISNAYKTLKQENYSWDIKLLELQKDRATTEEERKNIQKQILELQKKQALATADEADKAKIIAYYDKLSKALDEETIENTKTDYTWKQKLLKQDEQRLQTELNNAVEVAKAEGKSEEEIAKIKEDYLNKIKDKQLEQLEIQKTIDLARSNGAEQTAEMEKYYANEEARIAEETAKKIADIYSAIPAPQKDDGGPASETSDAEIKALEEVAQAQQKWADKLEAQRQAYFMADKERNIQRAKNYGATAEEIFAIQKHYADKELAYNLAQIEQEKQSALGQAKSEEEKASIVDFYTLKSAESYKKYKDEVDDASEEMEENQESTWSKFSNVVSVVTDKMKTAFKGVFDFTVKIFKGIGNVISSLWSGFVKALDFNPDEALDSLLAFEDKILTFFVETLPKIPQFLASALQSIGVLLNTLLENVDFSAIGDMLADAFVSALDMLPTLVKQVTGLITKLVQKLPSIINNVVPNITRAFIAIAKVIPDILPSMVDAFTALVNQVVTALPDIIDVTIPRLITGLVENLPTLINGLMTVINSLLDQLPRILGMLVDGITNIVVDLLRNPEKLLDLVFKLIDVIAQIPFLLLENAGKIVGAFIQAIPQLLARIFTELPRMIGEAIRNALSAIGGFFSWVWDGIKGIFGFANGTDNAPRGLAMVGEAGPELVNFRGGEQVINNRNTQKALQGIGSGTNNFNVTFNNLQDTTAFAMIQQLKAYNRNMAINGII